jgi:hypothetical protein
MFRQIGRSILNALRGTDSAVKENPASAVLEHAGESVRLTAAERALAYDAYVRRHVGIRSDEAETAIR